MFATLDSQNDNVSDNSIRLESLAQKLRKAGLLTPNRASSKNTDIHLNPQGIFFLEKAKKWANSKGKRGLIQLKILEMLKDDIRITDATIRHIAVAPFNAPTEQELLAAISGLEKLNLIKAHKAWQVALPIRITTPNSNYRWLEILEDETPPAWQDPVSSYPLQEALLSSISSNTNVYNLHAKNLVFTQGHNNQIKVSESSVLSQEQLAQISNIVSALKIQISSLSIDFEQQKALEKIIDECEQGLKQSDDVEKATTVLNRFKTSFEESIIDRVTGETSSFLFSSGTQLFNFATSLLAQLS